MPRKAGARTSYASRLCPPVPSARTLAFFELEAEESTDEEGGLVVEDEPNEEAEQDNGSDLDGFIVDNVDSDGLEDCSSSSFDEWDVADEGVDDDDLLLLHDAGFDVSKFRRKAGQDEGTGTEEWIRRLEDSGSDRACEIAQRLSSGQGLAVHVCNLAPLPRQEEEPLRKPVQLPARHEVQARHTEQERKRKAEELTQSEEHKREMEEVCPYRQEAAAKGPVRAGQTAAQQPQVEAARHAGPARRKDDAQRRREERELEDEVAQLNRTGQSFSFMKYQAEAARVEPKHAAQGPLLARSRLDRTGQATRQVAEDSTQKARRAHCVEGTVVRWSNTSSSASSSSSGSSSSSSSSTSSSESKTPALQLTPVKSARPVIPQRDLGRGGVRGQGRSGGHPGRGPAAANTKDAARVGGSAAAAAVAARHQRVLEWIRRLEATGSRRASEIARRLRTSLMNGRAGAAAGTLQPGSGGATDALRSHSRPYGSGLSARVHRGGSAPNPALQQ